MAEHHHCDCGHEHHHHETESNKYEEALNLYKINLSDADIQAAV